MLQLLPLRYSRLPAGQMQWDWSGATLEVARLEQFGFVGRLLALVPQRLGLGVVLLLARVARIALAVVVVGDERLDALVLQCLRLSSLW